MGTVFTLGSKEHTVGAKTIWEQENWERKRESWEAKGGEPAPLDRLELTNANKRLGTMILSHYDNTVFMPRMTSASHLLENSVDTLVSASVLSVLVPTHWSTLHICSFCWVLFQALDDIRESLRAACGNGTMTEKECNLVHVVGRLCSACLLGMTGSGRAELPCVLGTLVKTGNVIAFVRMFVLQSVACSQSCLEKNNKLWLMLLYISSSLCWDSLHACCDLGSSTLRSLLSFFGAFCTTDYYLTTATENNSL